MAQNGKISSFCGQIPTTTTRPSTAVISMACSMSPGRPLHSKTTLGPPPVASAIPAATGSLVGSKAAAAPSLRARSRRRADGSLTTTTSTPMATAQATAARPIGPAPRTATRSAGDT